MIRSEYPNIPNFERHILNVVAVLIVGLITWVGTTVNNLQTTVAAMQADLRHLSVEALDFRTGMRDRYTRSDAEREIGTIIKRINTLSESLRELRKRVDSDEKRQRT